MEEMSSMTRNNADHSQEAASLMIAVDDRVKDSNRALDDMVTSMASIRESSQQVAKIIKTIDEIAFQTNILALNAAVEAARAGEARDGLCRGGRRGQKSGPAVGAGRQGHSRPHRSVYRKGAARQRQGGTRGQRNAGITESVVKVKSLVEQVSVASREQAQGIDQVSQAIAQMEKLTQKTAATAEESAAASEELSAQAEASRISASSLHELVSGSGNHVTTTTVARPAKAPRSTPDFTALRPAA